MKIFLHKSPTSALVRSSLRYFLVLVILAGSIPAFARAMDADGGCVAAAFSACPSNMSANVNPGTCAAIVNYTVTATGDAPVTVSYVISGATTASGSGTGTGTAFSVGLSTVTVTASNCGGPVTCVFSVSVSDNQAPTAVCQNATVTLDGSGNGSLSASSVNNGSSDFCGIGTLAVAPNTFNCTNVGAPVPPSIWINEVHYDNTGTDAGEFIELAGTAGINLANYAIVRYNGAVTSSAVIYTTPAQTTVLTGTIPNQSNGYGTFAVFYPQDGLQNGSNDGFALVNTFTSTVVQLLSYEGVFTVGASQGLASGMVSTNLPVNEPGTITGGSIRLAGAGNNYGSFTWQAQAAPSSPGAINAGQTFTAAGGASVVLTVTDVNGNTGTCTADVTILDNQAPAITCPANVGVSAGVGLCDAVVTYTAPVGTDNCTPTTTQTAGLASGATFPVGVTTNTFSVTDGHSNTTTCSFTVTVSDGEVPVLTCPSNISVGNDMGICGAVVSYTAPVGTDNCAGATTTQTSGFASGATFPGGTTTNAFMVTDGAGNTATCSFDVVVSDTTAPVWTGCPSNFTVSSDSNSCDAVVTWIAPTASDNCSVASTISTDSPGDTFPLGTTTVTYDADDDAANATSCSFDVTVVDSIVPEAFCLSLTLTLDSLGNGSIVTSDIDNGSTDNCGIDSVSISMSAFSCAHVGSNSVILTVTDLAGNTATCTGIVTVTGQPLVGTLEADTTTCGYNVTCPGGNDGVAHVQATGGCGGATFLWSTGATSATVTGLSAGTVTVTVTDGGGGTDVQTIVITAPAAIQVSSTTTPSCFGDSTGSATVTATGGNDCGGYTYLWVGGSTTNSISGVPAGTYSVTVTDGEGCSMVQSVTVAASSPLNPTFTVNGDDLTSGQTWASYQWLLNGAPIPGATSSTYTATVSGNYSLQVTDANGCSGVSSSSNVVGISEVAFGADLHVYPNPAKDQFRVHTNSAIQEQVTISVYDVVGRRLSSIVLPELIEEVSIDLHGYAAGTYMVEVVTANGGLKSLRLVVQ